MNPFIHIETQRLIICENNVLDIIKGYDIIVDCTDNPLSKYLINDACVVKNKPLVYGSVFKFEGNVSVFNHHENAPTLRCLFPEINDEAPDCNRTGTIGIVTAITGLYMANEVLKIILESKYLLEGKLLIFNGLTSDISIINFNANPYARQISIENLKAAQSPTTLSPTQLKSLIDSKIEFQLLDVRTEKEHQFCNIGGILVPLDEFEEKINILNPNIKTIVYCHHGIRSRHAMDFLKDAAFKDVLHLEGGIHAWSVDVDESIPVY